MFFRKRAKAWLGAEVTTDIIFKALLNCKTVLPGRDMTDYLQLLQFTEWDEGFVVHLNMYRSAQFWFFTRKLCSMILQRKDASQWPHKTTQLYSWCVKASSHDLEQYFTISMTVLCTDLLSGSVRSIGLCLTHTPTLKRHLLHTLFASCCPLLGLEILLVSPCLLILFL